MYLALRLGKGGAAALFMLLLGIGSALAAQVQVLATSPAPQAELPLGQSFQVRLGYTSEHGLRLFVRGYYQGEQVTQGQRSNPSPVYDGPAGEAIVWLEYTRPTRLDELRIQVNDASWQTLESISVPVALHWHPEAPAINHADEFRALSAEQQQRVSVAMQQAYAEQDDRGINLLLIAMAWSVPAYLVLQLLLPLRWQGGWRKLALLPLLATGPILLYTLAGLLQGSNLWPLVMLFTLPFAFLYMLALLLARWFATKA